MKLNPEELLSDLIEIKKNLGAPDIFWNPSKIQLPNNVVIYGIPKELISGPFKLIVISGKNIEDDMEQRLLYIPQPDKRFHFMECRTIRGMRQSNRGERYIVTNDTTGKFEIVRDGYKVKERLDVCKNCLLEWNYKGYRRLRTEKQQDEAVKKFNIKEFFENCKPLFNLLPLRTNRTVLLEDEYNRDWKYISKAYRSCKGFCCENCGVDLHDHQDFLHAHHINGVKYDIRSDNIKVLCALCHSEQPNHSHLKKEPRFAEAKDFILRRRKEMNIQIPNSQLSCF